jgi:hypothetical protein
MIADIRRPYMPAKTWYFFYCPLRRGTKYRFFFFRVFISVEEKTDIAKAGAENIPGCCPPYDNRVRYRDGGVRFVRWLSRVYTSNPITKHINL